MITFETRPIEQSRLSYERGGVDFLERARHIGKEVTETLVAVFDNEKEIEVSADNCRIYLSQLDDDLDAVSLVDPRDNLAFWWFRFQDEERFLQIVSAVGEYAMQVITRIPVERVVKVYEEITQEDISTLDLDGLPESFD